MTSEETPEAALRLIKLYQETPHSTSKAKAMAERAIWNTLPKPLRTQIIKRETYNSKWLASMLGGEVTEYIAKDRILNAEAKGFPVESAWDHMDEGGSAGVKSSTVVRAITYGKQEAIKLYEQLSGEAVERSPKGKIADSVLEHAFHSRHGSACKAKYREAFKLMLEGKVKLSDALKNAKQAGAEPKKSPKRNPPAEKSEAVGVTESTKAPREEADPNRDTILDGDFAESRKLESDLWELLEQRVLEFTKGRIGGLDTEEGVLEVVRRFKINVHSSFSDLFRDIRKIRNRTGSRQLIAYNARRVNWALQTLRIEVKSKWTKDDLKDHSKDIKQAYRKLRARFHPDANLGADEAQLRALLTRSQEIEEAYGLLQDQIDP